MNTIIAFVIDNLSEMLVIVAIVAMALRFIFYSSPPGKRKPSYAERAGAAGEAKVVGMLRRLGLEFEHDLVFTRPDGSSVQADVIVRLRNGRLVLLEVKRYSGQVFGHDGEQHWTHRPKTGKQHQILNPIIQATWQADAIRQRTGYQPHIVVANAGTATFPTLRDVVSLRELPVRLEALASAGTDNTDAAWRRIQGWRAADNPGLAAKHVRRLQKKYG